MGLFDFLKKEDKKEARKDLKIDSIKVLGLGCENCHAVYENAKKAASDLGLDIEVEYVTEVEKVMEYGIMSMPIVLINEEVASRGRVLKAKDIYNLCVENY